GRAYQYKVLPFGLALSPHIFTKLAEGALAPLWERGICILNYLDDWLIVAHLRDLLCKHRDQVLQHLSLLGLQVSWEKSKLSPVQSISFLGMELDSVNMMACLTEQRVQSVLSCLNSIRHSTAVPLKFFQRLLGHMAAAAMVTPLGLLHMRPLQHWLHGQIPRWAWHRGTFRVGVTPECRLLRWGLFADWCSSCHEDPQRCSIGVVLSFLQEKLERRLSPSTLKIYVAAIAAYHDAVDGLSLGRHHLIIRFLRGARRLNPPRSHLIPSWDLSGVLTGLQRDPFEPLESVELKYLSLKTSLLIALTSIKRVGDLHTFSVSESCLEFGPADSHVRLRPRPGYVPKVPTTPFRDQVVNLQALPLEEADLALGCCVPFGLFASTRSEQLFVCFGGQQKGNAVSKQRLAHWVVDAITLACQCQVRCHCLRPPTVCFTLWHPCGAPPAGSQGVGQEETETLRPSCHNPELRWRCWWFGSSAET
ncbi:hypothetical protein M9458_004841, partial [Cirrhinus mrigala]